jgi:hypothetical protein
MGAISRPVLVDMCNGPCYYLRALLSSWGKYQSYEDICPDSKENLMIFYASKFHEWCDEQCNHLSELPQLTGMLFDIYRLQEETLNVESQQW